MFNFNFQNFFPEIVTMLLAMSPILELRGAIPVALAFYKMSPWAAYFWSVLGNIISMSVVLWLLGPISNFLMSRSKFFNNFFNSIFTRTRRNYNHTLNTWGALALVVFVAIPLPFTGGWTGAVVAFLFGIPFWRAFLLIGTGIAIAGLLVLGASLGILRLF